MSLPILPSIAVLPLFDQGGGSEGQYFSDGLSESLITALAQFEHLKVIGQHSSFQFRDSREDSKTIGRKLGVTHLLLGSVRHAGDTVRVNMELVNVSPGFRQSTRGTGHGAGPPAGPGSGSPGTW